MGAIFWSPLFLGVASAAFSIFASTKGWDATTLIAGAFTTVFIAAAYFAARKNAGKSQIGGSGGSAEALGDESDATGGAGGRGITGHGGAGGNAIAKGAGSRAKGGRGGDA